MRLRWCFAWVVLALPVAVAGAATGDCEAQVEHVSTRIVDRRFESELRVHHDAGREVLAWVYFEYWIRYENTEGEVLAERGVFRERVPGKSKTYTREDLSLTEPVRVDSVVIEDCRCSLPRQQAESNTGRAFPAGLLIGQEAGVAAPGVLVVDDHPLEGVHGLFAVEVLTRLAFGADQGDLLAAVLDRDGAGDALTVVELDPAVRHQGQRIHLLDVADVVCLLDVYVHPRLLSVVQR